MSAALPADASGWGVCDSRLLDRLLYKYRNQHRKTPYYHKLQQVRRAVRTVQADVRACMQAAHNEGHTDVAGVGDEAMVAALLAPRSPSHLSRLESLVYSLVCSERVLLHCSRPLYALLAQTYFMSFALASLALLARLYATQRAMLLQLLDKCVQARAARTASSADAGAVSQPSLAYSLLRALRTEVGELDWIEQCNGVEDIFAPCVKEPILTVAPSSADGSPSLLLAPPTLPSHPRPSSEGDSDEEAYEAVAAPAAAAPLPAQLKFFASPTVSKTKPLPPTTTRTPARPAAAAAHMPAQVAAAPTPGPVATPHRKRPASSLTPVQLEEVSDDDSHGDGSDVEEVSPPPPAPARKKQLAPLPTAATVLPTATPKPATVSKKLAAAPSTAAASVARPTTPKLSAPAPNAAAAAAPRGVSKGSATLAPSPTAKQPAAAVSAARSPSPAAAPSAVAPVSPSVLPRKKARVLSSLPPSSPPAPPAPTPRATPLSLLTHTLTSGGVASVSTLKKGKSKGLASGGASLKAKGKGKARAHTDEMDDIFG